ncbi:mitochondrial carrier domain-containing protein [Glomus cerebriforme]|uniref:Mitochondrial carrier domain-containing protein n=1 Tax=Glomus cerebriforme TaxID=658196 RepID=A0A397TDH7_9GLOM|nr:mitochondrial carrier domain-containing protein [Glomus cerebriforme]
MPETSASITVANNDSLSISSLAALPENAESENERISRIRKLFDELDYDKTGVLDRKNILIGLNKLKNHPSKNKYASELLQKCDVSSDGVVDFDEFKSFVEEKEKELLRLFLEIDKSHDMKLQPEELENALRKSGINCTQAELKKFIKTMDKDQNGVIDFSEWRDFLLLLPRETTMSEIFEYYQVIAQVSIDGEVIIPPTDPKYLLAGAIAGAVSRTATAPFDRLKVYFQIQTASPQLLTNAAKEIIVEGETQVTKRLVSSAYNNFINAIKNLYSSGGLINFFRGNGLNVAKIAPESAIKFFAYEQSKVAVANLMGTKDIGSIGMSGRFLSGGLGGVISQFAIYPLDTIKTRVMSSSGVSLNASPGGSILLKTASEMWKTQGFRSFYKGLIPALVGVFPYAAVDMSVYESLKLAYIKHEKKEASSFVSLGCGMISGSIGASIVYPLALVRTRLQAQGTPGHPQTYTGVFDVIKRTYKNERLRGFYKGLLPALVKVVPAAAITYMVYDKTKSKLELK